MTGPRPPAIPGPAQAAPGTQPVVLASRVPGLAIERLPGPRESWMVVHRPSGVPVVLDLAGLATAEIVAEELGDLLGWDRSAEEVADAADRLVYVEPGVDRIATRYGGVSLGELAVYVP